MAKAQEGFMPELGDKKIPVLTLDNKWHQLIKGFETDKRLCKLEEELNVLIKRQGKANTETKELKKLKKKLMAEIVKNADEAASGRSKEAVNKQEENKRLINECNQKIEEYEIELTELPEKIDSINRKLMSRTMELCYDTLKKNKAEIDEAAGWIDKTRVELKKRLVRKQEQEQMNQKIYTYMHNVFGPDVVNLFDMEYMNQ